MKNIIYLLTAMVIISSCSKKGCTDSNAVNYDSKAKSSDGSCVYSSNKSSSSSIDGVWVFDRSGFTGNGSNDLDSVDSYHDLETITYVVTDYSEYYSEGTYSRENSGVTVHGEWTVERLNTNQYSGGSKNMEDILTETDDSGYRRRFELRITTYGEMHKQLLPDNPTLFIGYDMYKLIYVK